MSSIPPNIIGTIFQAQVSANENAKKKDLERNKRAHDSTQQAKLTDRKQHEVEDTAETDGAIVHRQDERQRNGHDQHDTYQQHQQGHPDKIYSEGEEPDNTPEKEPPQNDDDDLQSHIDLSV